MPPRSLYRWKTFWFGLLIVVFFAWAWWDSHRHFSAITWIGKGLVWSGDGHIGCGPVPNPTTLPFEIQTARIPLEDIRLKSIIKTITIPHWLFFETFLFLWFLILGWRTRRHLHKSQRLPGQCSGGP